MCQRYSLANRRILGLQPELRVEDDAVSPIFFDEPETAKPETVRQKFPDAYKDTDFTGITLPIYVDGFYRGYVLSYVVIRRWVDPVVCEKYGITKDGAAPENKTAEGEEGETPKEPQKRPRVPVVLRRGASCVVLHEREESQVSLQQPQQLFLSTCRA